MYLSAGYPADLHSNKRLFTINTCTNIFCIFFRVANVLTGPCKLNAGDLLIVMLPRIPEWWLINIAAIRAGACLIIHANLIPSETVL